MKIRILDIAVLALIAFVTEAHAAPLHDFETAMCKAIYLKWGWPADAVLAGQLGATVLEFKYYEGKASDIKLITSGGMTKIDKSFIKAVSAAQFPPPPSWLPHKPTPMKATLFDGLGEQDVCSLSNVSFLQDPTQVVQ